jgi:sugar lactone lactonase YvrE
MRMQQLILASALLSSIVLTGCSSSFAPTLTGSAAPDVISGKPFSGKAMGGQQPVGSSHLYLYAADSTAYAHKSDSLIKADPTAQYPSQLDSNGNYYITTDPTSGGFYFEAGQYQCAVGQQVYLYTVGGNSGFGNNAAISEIAVLGNCNAFGASSPFSALTGNFVYMNEESTIAAAYSLAGFATDATHIASSSSALSQVSLVRAFQNASQIYNINAGAPGTANTVTPVGSGTVPYLEVNSLADILASCINSTSNSSTNCSTLFSNAPNSSGTVPTLTADAAINIAHNPSQNVSNLSTLYNQASPFQPILASPPNDFSVVLAFNNGSNSHPASIAIDANANVWVANNNKGSVTELSSTGQVLSPAGGYTNANMFAPDGLALDTNGNAYVADSDTDYVIMIKNGSTGATSSFTGTDLTGTPSGLAIDQNGNIWVAQETNSAVQFSPTGSENFATSGGGLKTPSFPTGIAIDPANDAFFVNYTVATVAEFNSSGAAVSTATGYASNLAQHTGQGIAFDDAGKFWVATQREASITIGSATTTAALASGSAAAGVTSPAGIAFDGASRAWIANTNGSVSVLNDDGSAFSDTSGFSGTNNNSATNALTGISAIAIDSAGDVWAAADATGILYEMIGAAVPVVTPIVAGLTTPYTPASKP